MTGDEGNGCDRNSEWVIDSSTAETNGGARLDSYWVLNLVTWPKFPAQSVHGVASDNVIQPSFLP